MSITKPRQFSFLAHAKNVPKVSVRPLTGLITGGLSTGIPNSPAQAVANCSAQYLNSTNTRKMNITSDLVLS